MGFTGMWEEEIYKGKELFGAPEGPCFSGRGRPITVKHLSVGAGHNSTMVPPVPDTPEVPLAANQDKRGRAATRASTDSGAGLTQTPKGSPRDGPNSYPWLGLCLLLILRKGSPNLQNLAQCMRPKKEKCPGLVLLRIWSSTAGILSTSR